MQMTIKEIAKIAGVHRSTVDKVLHNREGVSPAVRERVQKLLDEYDYKVNPIGKALKMQDKTINIGVLLLDVDALEFLKKGIQSELEKYPSFHINIEYKILTYTEIEAQRQAILDFCERGFDGLIVKAVNHKRIAEAIDLCEEQNIHVVTVNTDISDSSRLCYIGQDGYKAGRVAGRLMGEFLPARSKVAIITSDENQQQYFPFGTREDGFRAIISADYQQISLLPSVYTEEHPKLLVEKVVTLLNEHQDLSAIYLTCSGAGHIGQILSQFDRTDIKFFCFESYPEILKLMKEDIINVTLDSGLVKQGSKSLQTLLDKIIYEKDPPAEHYYTDIHILLKENI